jgi:Uri superfamily endonuclease
MKKPLRPADVAAAPAWCCTYQLLIELPRPIHLVVGRLGVFDLPPGRYVYTGSAKRNLQARVRRHLGRRRRLRWHIDYLLAAPAVRVYGVNYFTAAECKVNQATQGRVVIGHFGASDCRAGCRSHLKYLGPN